MKILHILDHSIPQIDGYAIRSKYILINQRRTGLKVGAITSPLHNATYVTNPEMYDAINYYRVSRSRIVSIPFIREYQIINRIKNEVMMLYQNEKFDLIHAHSPSLNGLAARLASKKLKIPYIYEVRAFWEDAAVDQGKFSRNSIRYKISSLMENIVMRDAAAITSIATYLVDQIVKRKVSRKKIFHVPNGVDTTKFFPIEKNAEILEKYNINQNRDVIIGFIGSFYKFEGLSLLIDALKKIHEKKFHVFLYLVGDGEEEKKIKKKVLRDSIKNVILTGKVPHSQVIKYYSIMDILIYPRLSERITEFTTPLKPLEAMAMGKAIIGSDVGGIRELLMNGENGLLFKAGDLNDLADKIVLLIERGLIEKMGRKARQFVVEEKDWRKIVEVYPKIYQRVIHNYK